MIWNWQQTDWPHFTYGKAQFEELEAQFLRQSGILLGSYRHLREDDKAGLAIELMTGEALKTSEIEGEILNRDSVHSSIRRHFGLDPGPQKISPAERGIADMMVDLYRKPAEPLTHEILFSWHAMIMAGRTDIADIGRYRTHAEPMQVVSGPDYKTKVHFEAPPSKSMQSEMARFISWFNDTAPGSAAPLPALIRASIAHLYFVSIHPFEDGNGRIARGLSQKALSQSLGQPFLIALSKVIEGRKKIYYSMLERSNKDNDIEKWIEYFASVILTSLDYTQQMVVFIIEKTQLYDKISGQLNPRQAKVLARMFREGLEGFKGGLSAENYISIAGASRATATRDLGGLMALGALVRTGERKSARYWLNVKSAKA
ncbi:MAG: Fic family protein [Rhodomicrobium sp.]|jgi:Fic family protein